MISAFISYSIKDSDKVEIIETLLKENDINPIIIANDRMPLKPLAEKVINGIDNCDVFIPLLTEKSYETQWINQEIGYSTAIVKFTFPIVEAEIMTKLKGFINKELDLPYSFDNQNENSFEEVVIKLIRDVKDLFIDDSKDLKNNMNPISLESDKLIQEIKKRNEINNKIKEIIESNEGIKRTEREALRLINILKNKSIKLRDIGYRVKITEDFE